MHIWKESVSFVHDSSQTCSLLLPSNMYKTVKRKKLLSRQRLVNELNIFIKFMQKLDPFQNYYIATSVSHNMDRIHIYYISSKYGFLKVWLKIYNFYAHVPFCHTGASGLAHWGQFPVLKHHWVTLVSTSLYLLLLCKCYLTPPTATAIQSHTRQHSLLQ